MKDVHTPPSWGECPLSGHTPCSSPAQLWAPERLLASRVENKATPGVTPRIAGKMVWPHL